MTQAPECLLLYVGGASFCFQGQNIDLGPILQMTGPHYSKLYIERQRLVQIKPSKKCVTPCQSVYSFACIDSKIIFLGSGKFSVGCGKGLHFLLLKQSAGNYIQADCVQRKCVPRIRAWVTLRELCMCTCVSVFVSHLFYRKGKDVDEVEGSSQL